MSTEITVTPDQIETIRNSIAKGASDQNLALFLFDCKRQGVHPMDKLIHYTQRTNGRTGAVTYTPITSIDFMRARASETGEHMGTDDAIFNGTPAATGFSASVTIYRLIGGQRCPFTATAYWDEYYASGDSPIAKKMPRMMLAKAAEALALRKGFPRQLSGIYEGAELPQNVEIIDTATGEIFDKPKDNLKDKMKLSASLLVALQKAAEIHPQIVNAELGSEGLESIADIKDDQQLARIVHAVTLKIGSAVPPTPPPPAAERAKVACVTQDQNLTIYKAYMTGCKKDRDNKFEPVEMESRKKEFRLWAKGMCGVTDSREIPAEHYDAALQAARRISSERDSVR